MKLDITKHKDVLLKLGGLGIIHDDPAKFEVEYEDDGIDSNWCVTFSAWTNHQVRIRYYDVCDPHIYIAAVYLPQHLQGNGTALRLLLQIIDVARQLKVDRIKLCAMRQEVNDNDEDYPTIGYYVWPKFGFDGNVVELMDDTITYDDLTSYMQETYCNDHHISVHDLIRVKGWDWWRIYGSTFDATFDVCPFSTSCAILRAYLEAKGIDYGF